MSHFRGFRFFPVIISGDRVKVSEIPRRLIPPLHSTLLLAELCSGVTELDSREAQLPDPMPQLRDSLNRGLAKVFRKFPLSLNLGRPIRPRRFRPAMEMSCGPLASGNLHTCDRSSGTQ